MRLLLSILFFVSFQTFAQKSVPELYFECFKNGDTLTMETIDKIKDLGIAKGGKISTDCWFKSWEMQIVNKNKSVILSVFSGSPTVPETMKTALKGDGSDQAQKFILQKAIIFDKSGNGIVEKKLGSATFYIQKIPNKICGATLQDTKPNSVIRAISNIAVVEGKPPMMVDYTGKLLMGKLKNIPFINQRIVLKDQVTKESKSTITNIYGDFTFTNINANDSVQMNFEGNPKDVEDGQLYMARADGTIIRGFNKANNVFFFDFIPPELVTLLMLKEEDTELKLKNFNNSSQSEITVIQEIHYAPNSFEIDVLASKKIDEIALALNHNKNFKLSITSHTDSKGEDPANLLLSQKRAQKVLDYLISMGIDKSRLISKGMGETQILNRCKNGIDCSEAEHELNRRTEFKFSK